MLALADVAAQFEFGSKYTEPEVNAVIDEQHTFRDQTRIRRALCDCG